MGYKLKLADENGILDDALIALIDLLTQGTNITLSVVDGKVVITAANGMPSGTVINAIMHWNGTNWVQTDRIKISGTIGDTSAYKLYVGNYGGSTFDGVVIGRGGGSTTGRYTMGVDSSGAYFSTSGSYGIRVYETPSGATNRIILITAKNFKVAENGTITSDILTANTLLKANADKEIVSIANVAGFLKNDGSGNFTYETPDGGVEQVNSDWDATSGVEEILNKPPIPGDIADLTDITDIIPTLDFKFKISADDTTPNYAISKIIAGDGIDVLKEGALSDESLKIYNTKKNLLAYLNVENHPFFNIQTTPPGEPAITDFVKIGDVAEPPSGDTTFKVVLKSGMTYDIDIKLIVEAVEESYKFELLLNGENTLWATGLTIEVGDNLKFTDSSNAIQETYLKYITLNTAQRIQIYDNPRQFSFVRISGRIETQTAPDTELSISARNVETVLATDDTHVEFRANSIISAKLCNF